MMTVNLDDIAILNIFGVDNRCSIDGISKSKFINLLQNAEFTEKREYYETKKKIIITYKMDKEIITFGDTEVEKHKFHQHKRTILIDNVNINKIVSKTILFGRKGFTYFTGYKNDRKMRPLCIILLKMGVYRRDFDETKYISFLIKDDELLEKYNEIWDKVTNSMKKDLIVNLYTMKYI